MVQTRRTYFMTNLQQKEKSSNLAHTLRQRLAWWTVNFYTFLLMNVNLIQEV